MPTFDPRHSVDLNSQAEFESDSIFKASTLHGIFQVADVFSMRDPSSEIRSILPEIRELMSIEFTNDGRYDYKPDKLSRDLYGRHDLDWILMWINRAAGVGEFFGTPLLVVDPSSLNDLRNSLLAAKRRVGERIQTLESSLILREVL